MATGGGNSKDAMGGKYGGGVRLRELRRLLIERLRRSGNENAVLDTRLLLCHALRIEEEEYFSRPDMMASAGQAREAERLAEMRAGGMPVARILGRRHFRKHEFLISSDVLDPRPDTETLIEAALALLRWESEKSGAGGEERRVRRGRIEDELALLDLGCGSGAILLSLLAELPRAQGLGCDISPSALAIARENAARLGLGARAQFVRSDWLADISGRFDLILANPPYIESAAISSLAPEVREHDPMIALDGGEDGLEAYRRIIPALGAHLAEDGLVLFEVGAGQAQAVLAMLAEQGLTPAGGNGGEEGKKEGVWFDLAGHARVVAARAGAREALRGLRQNEEN
jgi:release factor glutamine methyltransferase